jgi:co-chaperonin GroES (HSP10)
VSELRVQPKGKFVYCQLNLVEAGKTEGGIYLPEKHSEGTRLAKVISKGPDVGEDVKIDDIYAVEWFAGTVVNLVTRGILDDTFRLIPESELMAKIEEAGD